MLLSDTIKKLETVNRLLNGGDTISLTDSEENIRKILYGHVTKFSLFLFDYYFFFYIL